MATGEGDASGGEPAIRLRASTERVSLVLECAVKPVGYDIIRDGMIREFDQFLTRVDRLIADPREVG